MKLSVIIPCYNEEKTLEEIFHKVDQFNKFEKEIIIIDDCSNDGTANVINNLKIKNPTIKTFRHDKNLGKGGGIRTGLNLATGDLIIIQDADLEYDPSDYSNLVEPFLKTDAQVVYGTRFKGGGYSRLHFFWHYVANKILTLLTNIMTNLNMSDMETGYKVFKSEAIKSIDIKEDSFGIEPEITIKLAKKKFIFYEVPISYKGRSYQEGKKITLKDAFVAVYCIFKYRFFN
tara:strand:+ start:184 stop:876 length:693 start_codon:yes stop_codon:yes gene_type:complete